VPFRPPTTSRPETASGDRPPPLVSAKYLLLTTFTRDGAPQATPVRVLADGDRAYFRTWEASGVSKRLRHTDWVQVAPCTVLGVCRTGATVDATARLLADAEADRAAEQLARQYPGWRRFLSSLAHRVTRRRTVYYELQPDEAVAEPTAPAARAFPGPHMAVNLPAAVVCPVTGPATGRVRGSPAAPVHDLVERTPIGPGERP
jgi:PPOX class probable F420-dependent enzyme